MRIYTLLLLFLLTTFPVAAQTWTPVDEYRYNDETIVYARLSTGNVRSDNNPTRYTVGAFIDGECRATANATLGDDGTYLYVLRVHGDREGDHDKAISFKVYDRPNNFEFDATPSRSVFFTGESEGEPSDCIVLSFDGSIEPLRGFIVSVEALYAGQTGQLVLTPIPEDATFSTETLSLSFSGYPEQWVAATAEQNPTNPLVYDITPQVPGNIHVTLNGGAIPLYDTSGNAFTSFPVAAPVHLVKGWLWKTNAFADIAAADLSSVYGGDALVEIRTHEHLLYNDPEWGYFGTLLDVGLPRNTAYKVRMANGPMVGCLWNVTFPHGLSIEIESGWSWIPSPYYYNRTFEHAFADVELPTGLTIISKEGGAAEWDGSEWVGNLSAVMAGEYFICYSPSDESFTLTYADETLMAQGDEVSPVAPVGPWQFDASRFSDNMTLVAMVPGLDSPEDYVIGAFVGSECRGEGHWADGRFFITVHAEGYEQVTLRLYHLPTGAEYNIDESFGVQLHLGSVSHPVLLHSAEHATGISQSTTDSPSADSPSTEYYDLMGRRVAPTHRGLTIIRSEGRVKKRL